MDQYNDGRNSQMSTRDVFESSRQQQGMLLNQYQALCGIGEMFVRRALHQRQTSGFESFLNPQKDLDRPQTGRQLLSILQRESIEEQRINYLCTMAQTQQKLARENHRIYDQIISQEHEIERNLQIASSKQHIIDFIQYCDICVHRLLEMYARTEYDKCYKQICDRVAGQKLTEQLTNNLADLLSRFKLAYHVQKHLQKIQMPEMLAQLKKNDLQDFAQLMQNPSVQYLKELYTQSYKYPIYSLQKQLTYFKPLLLDYLRKLNKYGMIIPDLSEIDVNAVYPLPKPYFPGKQEGENSEENKEKDVLYNKLVHNEEQLLNYSILLTKNLCNMCLTPDAVDNYYKENIQDWILDKQLLRDKETFLEHCWFLFQDFRDYKDSVEEERRKFEEEVAAATAAGKYKKGEVPPTFEAKPPARDDSLIKLPDYFNIIGTRIIICVGAQRSFKSDMSYEALRQIEILARDFTIGTREASYVIHHPSNLKDIKDNIQEAFSKKMQAPRYLIVDQCPVLSDAQLGELNDFCLELVMDQQMMINDFIKKQSQYGFYTYFQSKQKPEVEEVDKNVKKSPGRGGKPPSSSGEKREIPISIHQDRRYSGIYKIICFHISVKDFVENQYYRVYQKQFYSEQIIKDQFNIPEPIIRQYQEGQITFVENKNQDFIDQYLNYQDFFKRLESFYKDMRFGISLVEDNRVLYRVPNIDDKSECQYFAIKLSHRILWETSDNMSVLCYTQQDQQEINQKVLFKLARQFSISYNDEVLKYQQQVDDIYAKMDPKKLKALQTAAQGAVKGGKGVPVQIDPLDIVDEKYLFKQLPEMAYVILPAINAYIQVKQDEQRLLQEFKIWQVICSMQLSSSLNKIYADERLSVTPKFLDLLNWKLIPNFEKLVVYGESVNPEVRGQEVILNDQALLMDQINKLNNKELQTLYTQIQTLIKESLQQHIQINKKIPYQFVQNIDELIEKLTQPKKEKEDVAEEPAVETAGKPVSGAADRKVPAGKGAPAPSISEQIEAFALETDAQAVLIVLLKFLCVVRQLLQNYVDQRTELTRVIAGLYGTRLNAGIPCNQDGKAKIPQKLQKQLEPQVQSFERGQLITTLVDQGAAGDAVGVDKLLEVLQSVQEKALQISQNVNLQAYNLETQEGFTVNLLDSSEHKVAEQIDMKIKEINDQVLEWCKELMKNWTEEAVGTFKAKQEELERMFVQAGSLIEQVSQNLENAVYAIKDVHTRLGEDGNLALQINYK